MRPVSLLIKQSIRSAVIYILIMITVLTITGRELWRQQTRLLIREIELSGIDYDAFRKMRVDGKALIRISRELSALIRKKPALKNCACIDPIGYLTFSLMASDYDLLDNRIPGGMTFLQGITELSGNKSFMELYGYCNAIWSDLECFPVLKDMTGSADITYEDTWYSLRNYGGSRRHEGTDLMASNNIRGYFHVVSITDGTVENMGWLEKGGNRVGIRSDSGGYFYYAHLDSYALGLAAGDRIRAGHTIGTMGDSGYGAEGTIGQFDVHLHLGIYVHTAFGEMSINPYYILKILEDNRQ